MTKKQYQKARAGMSVSDEDRAKYTAARVFLQGQWLGAILMVVSFSQLYWFTFTGTGPGSTWTLIIGLAILGAGGWVFWKNRKYSEQLDYPIFPKQEFAAVVTAGAGVVFWLLFLVLAVMTYFGSPVLPET